jgi:aminoglycoside phosphotransferase (APT) family kinase protein
LILPIFRMESRVPGPRSFFLKRCEREIEKGAEYINTVNADKPDNRKVWNTRLKGFGTMADHSEHSEKETIPVRAGEELDTQAVERYLKENLEGLGDEPLLVEQFPAGHSNLTYLIQIGDWEGVLRRPPFGPVPPKAHDMIREAKILKQLNRVLPLAPKPLAICEDTSVLGAPFYVMERKKGIVLDKTWPREYARTEENGRKISCAVVDTLVELHSIDYREAGLAAIGHPEGYMERQVSGWIQRYERARTDAIPLVDEIAQWLADHMPTSPAPAMIHNDYKLNNMLLAPDDPGSVTAVLDWEMSTIGDPLSDLGIAVSYWFEKDDPPELQRGLPSVTTNPGFFTRREFVERYAKKSGRDLENFQFYLTFAYFKVAVVLQQIYFRWKRGQTKDERFGSLIEGVRNLMEHAANVMRNGGF